MNGSCFAESRVPGSVEAGWKIGEYNRELEGDQSNEACSRRRPFRTAFSPSSGSSPWSRYLAARPPLSSALLASLSVVEELLILSLFLGTSPPIVLK